MKVAALDLGTNTFLCLIAQVEGGRVTHVFDDQVRVVRLGQDVNQTRRFHPDAIKRAREALTEFSLLIQKHRPDKVLAMATSAARDVTNGEELFEIGRDLGIPLQIIPGEREAEITYAGAVAGFGDQKKRLIIDVGGGSTELIVGQGTRMIAGESLNLGCVRLTEKFALKTPAEPAKLDEVSKWIRQEMAPTLGRLIQNSEGLDEIVAVAGTPTELARIEVGAFIPEKIDGFPLSEAKLLDWTRKFAADSKDAIQQKYGVHPGRADVILVGAMILLECLRLTGVKEMIVSTKGVRYGIALEMVKS
ncbi:MAG: Ppx/GppA family phosphatase [Bdellovibrionaceae bacterium]|nr:Ppx/GppA family phosphatase [Pseudobdellovibrionaceae bacterium]